MSVKRLFDDHPMPDGVAYQAADGVDVELRHDAGAMGLGGFGRDAESRCDLFVGVAFGEEL